MDVEKQGRTNGVPDAVGAAIRRGWLPALAAACAAFTALSGVAALGLHLLDADQAGSLLPMTAAVVVLATGGDVNVHGTARALGNSGADSLTDPLLFPLGPSLAGAVVLAGAFLWPLRHRARVTSAELLVRAFQVVLVFLSLAALFGWIADDTVRLDPVQLAGGDGAAGPLDDLPDLGGLTDALTEGVHHVVDAHITISFHAQLSHSVLGAAVWVLVVLTLAVLGSRRAPLPTRWRLLHTLLRPLLSSVLTMLLLVALAGTVGGLIAVWVEGAGSASAGGVLLAAPNGAWIALSLGLFVPWHGHATGALRPLLPSPLDRLLAHADGATDVTVQRLSELDGRVWLLPVAAALTLLATGILAASRAASAQAVLPGPQRWRHQGTCPPGTPPAGTLTARGISPTWLAVRAVGLALTTTAALLAGTALTDVQLRTHLSLLGVDLFHAGGALYASQAWNAVCAAGYGAGAGLLGALLFAATRGHPATTGAASPPTSPHVPETPPEPPRHNPYKAAQGTRPPPPGHAPPAEPHPGRAGTAEQPPRDPYADAPPVPPPPDPPARNPYKDR